jgi:RNA polymerase sigma factor (sigma-70 family)
MAQLSGGAAILGPIRTVLGGGTVAGLEDRDLLERFVARRDGSAFEALVRRHGPMVLGVCRRLAGDRHAAEDAFQATFLVLARRAASIRDPDLLGPWLYGVALRSAREAREHAGRIGGHPGIEGATEPIGDDGRHDRRLIDREEAEALHQEVARLPEKERVPVILCHLEGLTHAEAAQRLGWPVGTVSVRLMRARDRLRGRLIRSGVAPAGLLTGASLEGTATAAIADALVQSTCQAALPFAAGQAVGAGAVAVAERLVRIMAAAGLGRSAVASLAMLLLAAGASAVVIRGQGAAAVGPPATPMSPRPPAAVALAALPRRADDAKPAPTLNALLDDEIRNAGLDADAIADPPRRAEALLQVARAEIHRGDLRSARATLKRAIRAVGEGRPEMNWVHPHPIIRIAEAQAQAEDRVAAHQTFLRAIETVRALPVDRQLSEWINFIPIQVKTEGHAAAVEAIDAYRRFLTTEHVPPFERTHPFVIQLRAEAGDFEGALAEFRDVDDFFGPVVTYRYDALVGIARALQPGDEARDEVLREVSQAVLAVEHPEMKGHYLSGLAEVLIRLGRLDEASTMVSVIEPGDEPREFADLGRDQKGLTLLDLAEARLKAGDRAGAKRSAAEAIDVIEDIDGYQLKGYALERAAHLLAELGEFDRARRLIDDEMRAYHRPASLRWLAEQQERTGAKEAARETLRAAIRLDEDRRRERRAKPDPSAPPIDQPAMIEAELAQLRAIVEAQLGDLPAAWRALDVLTEEKARNEAIQAVAVSRASAGDVASAMTIADRMTDRAARSQARLRIILSFTPPVGVPRPARP